MIFLGDGRFQPARVGEDSWCSLKVLSDRSGNLRSAQNSSSSLKRPAKLQTPHPLIPLKGACRSFWKRRSYEMLGASVHGPISDLKAEPR